MQMIAMMESKRRSFALLAKYVVYPQDAAKQTQHQIHDPAEAATFH